MAEVIRMPLLSDTMKEGVIAQWNVKVGDRVKSDDVIADVETDKATMEVNPYVDGTVLYIAGDKGVAIPVNGIMAIIGEEGEDITHLLEESASSEKASDKAPAAEKAQEEKKAEPSPAAAIPADVTIVRMPLLSDTMKEGKIVAWLRNEGDKVKSDDVLAEVETDKATMEVMGYADGTLLHIGVQAGQAAKINEIIAIVGPEGTDISGILKAEKEPQADTAAADKEKNKAEAPRPSSAGDHQDAAPDTAGGGQSRVKISPLALSLAKDRGIDISTIKGSGDGGRIIKRDIDNYQTPAAGQPSAPAGAGMVTAQEGHTDVPLSQMRKVIAQRLSESKFQAPHFYLRMTVKMDHAIKAREAMNAISPVKISFNDLVIKACATALKKHPAVNSSWMGDFIRTHQHIHIGTAVAVEEGLIVPVIKFASEKTLSQIAQDSKELIKKARDKKLQPQEFTGNTFTISNLGMMDIDEFTAIINPPDSCILAVGKIEATPVVENDEIVVRQLMKITLSCDHRVVDGAVGSAFLQTLKEYLENPVNMLV